jgi:hypothetical protein
MSSLARFASAIQFSSSGKACGIRGQSASSVLNPASLALKGLPKVGRGALTLGVTTCNRYLCVRDAANAASGNVCKLGLMSHRISSRTRRDFSESRR